MQSPAFYFSLGRVPNDAVPFRVERDGPDRCPVPCLPGPARRVTFAGLKIGLVPCRQDRMVFPGMPLGGGDVAQAAVAVLDVVPVHEVLSPLAGFVQAGGLRPGWRSRAPGIRGGTSPS